LLVLLTVLLLAGAGTVCYFIFRPQKAMIPQIPRDGLDAEVAAAIDRACADIGAKPRSANAWGHLGMVLFAQDMYTPSASVFAEAEKLNPRDPRWPYFGGLALMLEKPAEGIVRLERAVTLAPDDFSLRLRLAEEYMKLQRIDEADALFRQLFREAPSHARILLGRGQILSRRGGWQEAIEPLKAASEDPTARRSARVALSEAYARIGNAAESEEQRKRAESVPGDLNWADPILQQAKVLRTGLQPRIDQALDMMKKGQVQQAGELISEVLRDHPQSDEALLTLAKILIQGNQFEPAEQALRRAITINAQLVDGYFLLGGIDVVLHKNYISAEKHFRRSIELKPSHAQAHARLGDCRLKQGNKPGAMAAFRDAVRYRPDLAQAHLELGALLLEAGQIDDAIRQLETAVRLEETNERARGLLKEALAKKKT
jgi:tetratricopeptide (TPR) repeat protein